MKISKKELAEIASEPIGFCEWFEQTARAEGHEPTEELLDKVLTRMYYAGVIMMPAWILIKLYYTKGI